MEEMTGNRTGRAGQLEPGRHGAGDLQPDRKDYDSQSGRAYYDLQRDGVYFDSLPGRADFDSRSDRLDFEDFEKKLPVRLNEQQREAARTVDGPVLLLAVPGSGKTTVLVARLGYMVLASWCQRAAGRLTHGR